MASFVAVPLFNTKNFDIFDKSGMSVNPKQKMSVYKSSVLG